jgi:hypothetical protein
MWQNSGAMAFHAIGRPAERRFQRIGRKVSKIRATGGRDFAADGGSGQTWNQRKAGWSLPVTSAMIRS